MTSYKTGVLIRVLIFTLALTHCEFLDKSFRLCDFLLCLSLTDKKVITVQIDRAVLESK